MPVPGYDVTSYLVLCSFHFRKGGYDFMQMGTERYVEVCRGVTRGM